MKTLIWTLIISVGLWPALEAINPRMAHARVPAAVSTTNTSSQTCTDSRGTYRGFSDSNCYNYDSTTANANQQNTQDDTKDTNDQGAQQSKMLGMMAIAAGMAMIAAGAAMMPTNPGAGAALMAAGMALLMAGMQALAAAGEMGKNSGISGYRAGNMSNITGIDPVKAGAQGSALANKGNASGIKIDPSLTRTGKASAIFDDFEQKTGMSRDDFVSQLEDGVSPAEMMAGNPKFGGRSEEDFKNMMANSAANGTMGADEAMGQMGLTPEDLAAMTKNSGMSATGEDNSYAVGGGGAGGSGSGASRKPDSSYGNPNLDALFGAPGNKDGAGGAGILGANGLPLSPDLQAALDRNGITGRSIFQMVSEQYKKKTPMMFGMPLRKPTGTEDNPFSNLGGGGKVEF